MTSTVLVVDDEPDLLETLRYNLGRDGHQVLVAEDGASALQLLRQRSIQLVLLDVMLPDLTGTELLRRIRASKQLQNLPVILLTAKGEEIDRVVGFELGADDYVVKPFSTRELLLRVRALLRRHAEPAATAMLLELGDLRLDKHNHQVWVGAEEVRLTALEFKLLAVLLERRGRVQRRELLLSDVWGINAAITTRTVDTHVKRLRQKLGTAGRHIETLRGVGYRCVVEGAEA